ncbi:sigma-70 family RNA polymerase sigma factor [Paenibacillus sp. FSL M8-0334]|uniref:sigma-70 family RNA polymerase sigma factor n=1 Tax=Paenibacillus sp. FSL M8-0334 TaxID=2921623 RepID=UPI0030F73BD0
MNRDLKNRKAIEKGFSSYASTTLRHASRDFFKKLCMENDRFRPFDEADFQINVAFKFCESPFIILEQNIALLQAMNDLESSERELLHLKYFQDKTDEDIARVFGVTRQAITKSKKNCCSNLKSITNLPLLKINNRSPP